MAKKYWKVQAWDSTELLYEKNFLYGQMTEKSMKQLLRMLTAKIALTDDEIIGCFAKKRTKIYQQHLDVVYLKGKTNALSCGENPYVVATVEER